jgi:hypothetical protein
VFCHDGIMGIVLFYPFKILSDFSKRKLSLVNCNVLITAAVSRVYYHGVNQHHTLGKLCFYY